LQAINKNLLEKTGDGGFIDAGIQMINMTVNQAQLLVVTGVAQVSIMSEAYDTYNEVRQIEGDNDVVVHSPMVTYKGRQNYKFDVFLPLKNYSVNRSSGIQQKDDVIGDMGTAMSKNIYQGMRERAFTQSVLSKTAVQPGEQLAVTENGLGSSLRKFLAPRVNAPSLETYELTWDLIPRSEKEMAHIKNILKVFNYLSVPNFSKTDLFYTMPPVMFMEILSKNHTKNKTFKIREKRQYYLTNITTVYSSSDGEVILTPEGYPMFITLKINLIKADLTSAEEAYQHPFM